MEFHELEKLIQDTITSYEDDVYPDEPDTDGMAENIALAIARKFGVAPDQGSLDAHTVVVARKVAR